MLRDAVLIVAGGLLQVPAIEIAKQMGLVTIVTDSNPNAPAMKLADEVATIDIYDVPAYIALVEELSKRYSLKGIFTEGADVEVTVASVAAHLGLPGIPIESAKRCKNKVLMRKAFEKNGIPNPRWAEVSDEQSLNREAKRIG
ncbi:carboxylate--amine ligase, partial [Chloroflexota bacterium]